MSVTLWLLLAYLSPYSISKNLSWTLYSFSHHLSQLFSRGAISFFCFLKYKGTYYLNLYMNLRMHKTASRHLYNWHGSRHISQEKEWKKILLSSTTPLLLMFTAHPSSSPSMTGEKWDSEKSGWVTAMIKGPEKGKHGTNRVMDVKQPLPCLSGQHQRWRGQCPNWFYCSLPRPAETLKHPPDETLKPSTPNHAWTMFMRASATGDEDWKAKGWIACIYRQ